MTEQKKSPEKTEKAGQAPHPEKLAERASSEKKHFKQKGHEVRK